MIGSQGQGLAGCLRLMYTNDNETKNHIIYLISKINCSMDNNKR